MMSSEQNVLLAQVPLTVSPFITLPKAPTLPHNYARLPSTLPPSLLTSTLDPSSQLPNYVTSSTGFRAHPSTIISQNNALRQQLDNAAREGRQKIEEWRNGIRERELREKRRKAPGWLDSEDKILRPESTVGKKGEDAAPGASLLDVDDRLVEEVTRQEGPDLGAEMDRAFG